MSGPTVTGGEEARRVAVIGSAPVGLDAALPALAHGYEVTVYEAGERPACTAKYGNPHECDATSSPMKLSAALLGWEWADCLDQAAHGVDALRGLAELAGTS